MPPTLRVTLLGDFSLADDDGPVTSVRTARLQSLLTHLIVHRHAPQPRRRLAFVLWPDSTESQARTNLRRELHHLRRALPRADTLLHVDSRTLRWLGGPSCSVDVVDFESAVARADEAEARGDAASVRARLGEAAALYRGDLLPSCYDGWIDGERDRLRRAFQGVLDRLVRVCEAERDHPSAIRWAERLVRHDPLREASYARLIDLHRAQGDRAAALRVYGECEGVLERELGLAPGRVTLEARDRAMAAEPPTREPPASTGGAGGPPPSATAGSAPAVPVEPRGGPSPETPLVGRVRERDTMRDWMERPERAEGAGSRQVLLLLGEPGIGKTRLLDELASDVRAGGGRTIRGRGFEAEMVRAYGAWIDALRSVPHDWLADAPDLGSLLPSARGPATVPADRNRLFDAVARWLAGLGADGGAALLVDDIQWLDEASAALLHYVTRVLADLPILVACAARPGEVQGNAPVSALLRSLERERRARTIELAPMSREDTTAVARLLDDEVDGDRIFADSGGNPLFALELTRALRDDGGGGRAGSVEELIRTRIARLDGSARELVTWAAALGRAFDPSTLALVTGRPPSELLAALDQLEHHGILRPGDPAGGETDYDFAHDVVRRIAYGGLSAPRRRLLHLQIARALADRPDPDGALAADVAHHASLGRDPALAAKACVTAGQRCVRLFANAEATELARRGVEHTRALEESERIRQHMALLRVAVDAGTRPGRAAALEEELRGLIADARAAGMVEEEAIGYGLLSVLSYEHEDFGRVHESSLRAAETLRGPGTAPTQDPGVTARTLGLSGACLASIGRDMPRAEALLLEAETLASRTGVELTDVPMGLGIVRYFDADHAEAARHLEHGLRLARREHDHFRECECLTVLVMLALESRAPERALTLCRELAPVAARLKGGSEAPFSRALEALARYAMGEDEADDDLAGALDALRRLDASRKRAYVLTMAAEADLETGRVDTAVERADAALEAAGVVQDTSGMALAGATLARALLARGERERARKEVTVLQSDLGEEEGLSARARVTLDAVARRLSLAARSDP